MVKYIFFQQRQKDFALYHLHRLKITHDKICVMNRVLRTYNVPVDVWHTIWTFSFLSIQDAEMKWRYRSTVKSFQIACSRRNGFWDDTCHDTDDEHWVFFVCDQMKNVRLEAINCLVCGNYKMSQSLQGIDEQYLWCTC
jgi:hypothetical protein